MIDVFIERNMHKMNKKKVVVSVDEQESKQYKELQLIVEQIDFSLIHSTCEYSQYLPNGPKRRRLSQVNLENNEQELQKYEAESEELAKQIEISRKALDIIYNMRRIHFKRFISKYGDYPRKVESKSFLMERIVEHGRRIPLWIGKDNESPPILCGAIGADENYVAKVGDMVAALVKQDDSQNWILAEIAAYNFQTKEYTVDDIYEEEKMEQVISQENVVPLPKMRADPKTNPEALFPEGSLVLALYPQTTCFYRAVVKEKPEGPHDPYRISFADERSGSGYTPAENVHQQYVILYRSGGDDVEEEESENEEKE